jgi:hypothetical protein
VLTFTGHTTTGFRKLVGNMYATRGGAASNATSRREFMDVSSRMLHIEAAIANEAFQQALGKVTDSLGSVPPELLLAAERSHVDDIAARKRYKAAQERYLALAAADASEGRSTHVSRTILTLPAVVDRLAEYARTAQRLRARRNAFGKWRAILADKAKVLHRTASAAHAEMERARLSMDKALEEIQRQEVSVRARERALPQLEAEAREMVERAAADAKALAAEARLAELERAEAARKQAAEQAARLTDAARAEAARLADAARAEAARLADVAKAEAARIVHLAREEAASQFSFEREEASRILEAAKEEAARAIAEAEEAARKAAEGVRRTLTEREATLLAREAAMARELLALEQRKEHLAKVETDTAARWAAADSAAEAAAAESRAAAAESRAAAMAVSESATAHASAMREQAEAEAAAARAQAAAEAAAARAQAAAEAAVARAQAAEYAATARAQTAFEAAEAAAAREQAAAEREAAALERETAAAEKVAAAAALIESTTDTAASVGRLSTAVAAANALAESERKKAAEAIRQRDSARSDFARARAEAEGLGTQLKENIKGREKLQSELARYSGMEERYRAKAEARAVAQRASELRAAGERVVALEKQVMELQAALRAAGLEHIFDGSAASLLPTPLPVPATAAVQTAMRAAAPATEVPRNGSTARGVGTTRGAPSPRPSTTSQPSISSRATTRPTSSGHASRTISGTSSPIAIPPSAWPAVPSLSASPTPPRPPPSSAAVATLLPPHQAAPAVAPSPLSPTRAATAWPAPVNYEPISTDQSISTNQSISTDQSISGASTSRSPAPRTAMDTTAAGDDVANTTVAPDAAAAAEKAARAAEAREAYLAAVFAAEDKFIEERERRSRIEGGGAA